MARMPYTHVARVHRDDLTKSVTLDVIEDTTVVELHDGDEFVTISTVVPLFEETP